MSLQTKGARRKGSGAGSEARLSEAWDEFFAAIRRARGRAARQHGHELTLSQWHLLSALAETPEAKIGDLAEAAGVAAATATRMLDALERAEIVERRPSEADRRCVTVELTGKGRRLLDEKRQIVESHRRALHDSLSLAERRQAERLLRHLAEVIDEL
jgi:DNA-binding MarR family transcriptional regulator